MITTQALRTDQATPPPDAPARYGDGRDTLARICAETRADVERRQAAMPMEALKAQLRDISPPRGFGNALKEATVGGGIGLVAEIKKASPSAGLIRPDIDAAELARAYAAGGATCLSVLTEEHWFGGSIPDLQAARAAVELPVLRKDFILDPWQVYESRAIGADCILLIMAALEDAQARELEEIARGLDMDVLAEVHDCGELDRALGLQTNLIGINNRDLKTLRTDIATTLTVAPLLPPDRFLIAESGIKGHEDITRLAETGVRSFLVGESLMRQPDVQQAVRDLLGHYAPKPLPGA